MPHTGADQRLACAACLPPVQGNRQQILDCRDDGLRAYSALKKMRFLQPGQPSADELAQQAAALYQAIPPARLARQRGIHLEHSAAIDAYLRCGSAAAAGWGAGQRCGCLLLSLQAPSFDTLVCAAPLLGPP